MANMNLFVLVSTSSDTKPSNSPNLSNFKWARDISGIPAENPISQVVPVAAAGNATAFTGASKKFIYVEVDQEVDLVINGNDPITVKPIVINTSKYPGMFFLSGDVTSLQIVNNGAAAAEVFVASIE
jgi:hypothetical protein